MGDDGLRQLGNQDEEIARTVRAVLADATIRDADILPNVMRRLHGRANPGLVSLEIKRQMSREA